MWAYRLVAPNQLKMVDIAQPEIELLGEDELLVRTLAGGICGSDLPHFRGTVPLAKRYSDKVSMPGDVGFPLHEIVGQVISENRFLPAGSKVVGWAPAMNGLAEYVIVRNSDVICYENKFHPTEAVMIQPLACVVDAMRWMKSDIPKVVAIIGLGPIGLLFAKVIKELGAEHVIGVDLVDRSSVADMFGIDECINVHSRIWAESIQSQSKRPDLIVEAVGHQVSTLVDAVHAVSSGGQVVYFGIPDDEVYPFPMYEFLRKNARLVAGITQSRTSSLRVANEYLLHWRELPSAYITSVYTFADAQSAFEEAHVPAPHRIKVVLDLWNTDAAH